MGVPDRVDERTKLLPQGHDSPLQSPPDHATDKQDKSSSTEDSCSNVSLEDPEKPDKPMLPLGEEAWDLSSMAFQFTLRQVVRQAMTLTDAAFLGHIGTKELAGVSLAAMWMGVPSTFVQFAIQAISTLCSQAYGAGNHKLVGIWLQTSIWFAISSAIPVMVLYLCVGKFVGITMDDAETVHYAQQFATVMALGLIPQFLYGATSTYFATQGIIMPATFCSCITMLLNIVFNRFFIYGAFGWNGLGFVGSPLATVTSTCVQLGLFLLYTVVWKRYHVETWGGWTKECLRRDRMKTFLSLAVPMGASSVVDWASATVAGAFSGLLGPSIAAAEAVMTGVFGVTNIAVNGFSLATQIRMSRYLGEGNAPAAKRVLTLGGAIVFVSALMILIVVVLLRKVIFRIWSDDEEIIAICTQTLAVFVLCGLIAFVRFLLTATLNALSQAQLNLWANNFASWCVYVPLSYLLPVTLSWGLPGFWWADTSGETCKLIIMAWGISRVNWIAAAKQAQLEAEADDDKVTTASADEKLELELESIARTPEQTRAALMGTPSTTPNHRQRMRILRERQAAIDKANDKAEARAAEI